MTLKSIFGRRWLHALGLAGAAAAGYLFALTTAPATAQQPGKVAAPAPLPEPDKQWVAYFNYDGKFIPVTRLELGEFLINRGGHEKVELLVNRKIIDFEAAKRGVKVEPKEVEAGLAEDLKGMGISLQDFEKHVLPRYHKTLFEWGEDVIKPRLLLGKMCQDRVKVTEEDVLHAFENRYGERRQAKVICWNKDDLKAAQKQWDEARKSDADFDRIARQQADPNLAAAEGKIAPIGKFPDVPDDTCTKELYKLNVGDMSGLIETPAGVMCIKCIAIIPPDPKVKLEGEVRRTLEKEMIDKKMSAAIPEFFAKCKEVAKPTILLKGAPSLKEFEDMAANELQQSGLVRPGSPTPKP